MSTRCVICIAEDGRFKGTLCRWDGYPADVGMTLLKAYSDRRLLERLVSMGGISVLRVSIDGTAFLGDGRWPKTADDPADLMEEAGADYAYVFEEDGRWTMMRHGVPDRMSLLDVLRDVPGHGLKYLPAGGVPLQLPIASRPGGGRPPGSRCSSG